MAKITGKAVVIWICLAFISDLIIYVLRRRGNQINRSHQRDKLIQSGEHDSPCDRKCGESAIPILVFYLAFVLNITIIERTPGNQMKYNLELFWTVREIINGRRELISEIFWNVVLFVPIGVLTSIILPGQLSQIGQPDQCEQQKRQSSHRLCGSANSSRFVVLVGFLLSTAIEVTQLFTHRGLFEFDDIIYNTLGTAIGVVIYFAVLHAMRFRPRFCHIENKNNNV